MKNTREITTGAMLLAIFGAILFIDRSLLLLPYYLIALVVAVVIIVYGNKYSVKSGAILSFTTILLTIIICPTPDSLFYIAMGIIIGNVYNILIKKNFKQNVLLFATMLICIVCEMIYLFIITPAFFNITFDQTILGLKETMNTMIDIFKSSAGNSVPSSEFNILYSIFTDEVIKTISILGTVLLGLMEGLIVHFAVIFMFKRFNINTINIDASSMIKLSPVAAYILMAGSFCFLAFYYVKDSNISNILLFIGFISMFVLAYYGYIYCTLYIRIRGQKKLLILLIIGIILFIPFSIFFLMIIGFLYGAGPLKRKLYYDGGNNESH